MARLKFVIADMDEAYVESIANYIMSTHSNKFHCYSFSKKETLYEFLNNSSTKMDILLAAPEMIDTAVPRNKFVCGLILSPGKSAAGYLEFDSVNKFQHADQIVSDILKIFSDKYDYEGYIAGGDKATQVIAVYSPSGGAGKTTIAIAASIICAQRGLSVFYLNLESLQSTSMFFKESENSNFSKILYHLKGDNKNFSLKIEASRSVDSQFGIHYFAPPDSAMEIQEMKPEEVRKLIDNFRTMGQYDVVFVDMDSSFSMNNIAVMDESDEVYTVFGYDLYSETKAKGFLDEMETVSKRFGTDFISKMTMIINKNHNNYSSELAQLEYKGKRITTIIPLDTALFSGDINRMIDAEYAAGREIHQLASKILTK